MHAQGRPHRPSKPRPSMPTTDDEIREKYLERAIRELNTLTRELQSCPHCPRGNLLPVLGSGHPQADVIRVILDNLNTHGPGSLYDAFEPAEARRLVEKLEFHYTPKHGSWLNMAEIELSILQRQCLNRRIANEAMLKREVAAWEQHRNAAQDTIDWRFTITDAREKLKRLYPTNSLR